MFKDFVSKLLNLENSTELGDFMLINSKYINSLFETKLAIIRHDILIAKWRKAINPVIAVSKFRSILKKKTKSKRK